METTFRNGHGFAKGKLTDMTGKVTVDKEYLIDSGASQSMISMSNLMRLLRAGAKDVRIVGIRTFGTASGPANFFKLDGLTMTFGRVPLGGGKQQDVDCVLPVALGFADILGSDQLKVTGTRFIFDPAGNTATLERRIR